MPTSEEYTYTFLPSWNGISSSANLLERIYGDYPYATIGYKDPDVSFEYAWRTTYAEKIESLEAEVHRLKSTVELLIKKLEEMTKAGTFMTDMELLDLLEM